MDSINRVGAELFVEGEQKAREAFRNFADEMKNVGRDSTSAYATSERQVQNLRSEIERTRDAARLLDIQFTQLATKQRGTPLGAQADARAQDAARVVRSAESELSALSRGVNAGGAQFAALEHGASSLKNVLGALKQEHLDLRKELAQESGSSRLFNVAEGVLLHDAIREAISLVIDFGKAAVESYQEAMKAQYDLIRASQTYGQSINENIGRAQALALVNAGKFTTTEAQQFLGAAVPFAAQAGRPSQVGDAAQAAADLASYFGIANDKAIELFGNASKGGEAFEKLVGERDVDALNRYSEAHGKLRENLTRTEEAEARFQELLRLGNQARGAAAKEGASPTETLARATGFRGFRAFAEELSNSGALTAYPDAQNALRGYLYSQPLSDKEVDTRDATAKKAAQDNRRLELAQHLREVNATNDKTNLEQQKKDDEAERRAIEKLKHLRAEADETLDSLAVKVAGNNPFTKLYLDSDRSIEKLREHFKELGDGSVEQLVRMQREADAVAASNLRIETSLKAVELQFQADALKKPFAGLTGEQERTLAVLNKEVEAAKNIPGLLAHANLVGLANQYRYGFNGNPNLLAQQGVSVDARGQFQANPDYLAGQQYKSLVELLSRYGKELGYAGAQMRDEINKQLTSLYEGLSPQARREVAFSPNTSETFRKAYREQAQFQQEQIKHQLELNQAGRCGIELANRKISELARLAPGADADSVRKQFLEITKGLDPKELTGPIKQAMIAAYEEEAKHTLDLEKDAKNFREQLVGRGGVLYQIKDAIESLKSGAPAAEARQNFETARGAGLPALRDSARAPADGDGGVKVNPYAQQLFRARPGYSPANDPREYDPRNAYQREFLNTGYLLNLRSSLPPMPDAQAHAETLNAHAGLIKALNTLTKAVSKGGEVTLRIVSDGSFEITGRAPAAERIDY